MLIYIAKFRRAYVNLIFDCNKYKTDCYNWEKCLYRHFSQTLRIFLNLT